MTVYNGLNDPGLARHDRVLAVGAFDGVHRGHQRLLNHVCRIAHEYGVRSAIMTFEPIPAQVFRPAGPLGSRLTLREERNRELSRQCIHEALIIDFDEQFRAMYELKKSQVQAAFDKQQKEIDRLEDFIARNKARVATTNMAKSRQKKLDKMDIITIAREKPKPSFRFPEARTPGRVLVQTKDLVIGYEEALTRPLDLTVERGQKIALRGVNGLGKTTLMNTLLGLLKPLSGTVALDPYAVVGHFVQESARNNSRTALEEIWHEFPSMGNGEVRAALAKCGLTTEHITSQMMVLSGGENAKVRLCSLMLRDSNFLVLDEPTNHLDQDAKDELARALTEFRGTIQLVCHEPEFYQNWITDVWNAEDWTTKVV